MPETLSRSQVRLVAAMYGAMAVISGLLIFERYLIYIQNPQDVIAAGGMYAGGDLLLEIMVLCLFLVPTATLIFFIRKSESAYTTYAKVLLGVSLTAPLSLGLMFVPVFNEWYLGEAILFRLFATPVFAVVLILSLCLTRFSHARRLIACALLIEALPFAVAIGILVFSSMSRHG
jgi:hypothetical protein